MTNQNHLTWSCHKESFLTLNHKGTQKVNSKLQSSLGTSYYVIGARGGVVAKALRYYATNRQVAGSIPDGFIGMFQRHNSAGRTMVLGSTQPLTEMSTMCISWG